MHFRTYFRIHNLPSYGKIYQTKENVMSKSSDEIRDEYIKYQ